jgi:serine/threonine protein kinase
MASEPLPPGAGFAGRRIVRVLGRGRAGTTYVALSTAGMPVVLRVFPGAGRPEVTGALIREQERVEAFRHPNIAPVLDAGVEDGAFYVVRPFVPGASLVSARIPPGGGLSLLSTVAEAIGAAHEAGLVHGSLRPENVVLAGAGGPMVVDLGALTSTRPAEEWRGLTAPEVEGGAAPTAAADVYGLAAMALRIASPDHPELARRWRTRFAFGRALAAEPAERPPIEAIGASLRRLAHDAGPTALRRQSPR